MGKAHIGSSGWRYAPWRGKFYLADLRQSDEVHHASRQFDSIEINRTFYSLQRSESFAYRYAQTPRGFVFAVKRPRYITMLRVRHIDGALANFFAAGVLDLCEKLGPLLWQFPPNLQYDEALFDQFLTRLPRIGDNALILALNYDSHLKRAAPSFPGGTRRLRRGRGAPTELRHSRFHCAAAQAQLGAGGRRHRCALAQTARCQRRLRLCACMAMWSSTPAAAATRHWTTGWHAFALGCAVRRCAPAARSPARARLGHASHAMCMATSITTPR